MKNLNFERSVWKNNQLILEPSSVINWMSTRTLIPTPIFINGVIRIYFTGTDQKNDGRIGYVDVDPESPARILNDQPRMVVDIGRAGQFDDCGVNATSILSCQSKLLMYYFGHQRVEKVPQLLFTGLAESSDGGRAFEKGSRVPLLDRTEQEPFVRSASVVLPQNNAFRMWYVGAESWFESGAPASAPRYGIKTMLSSDPRRWGGEPSLCLSPSPSTNEVGFGRPWVSEIDGNYNLWFSLRSRLASGSIRYTGLHHAISVDGLEWQRTGVVDIQASGEEWDLDGICYASHIRVSSSREYLFYTGNNGRRQSFGYAERVQ